MGAGVGYGVGDTLRLKLDFQAGTLSGAKNGEDVGVIVTGLDTNRGFHWMVQVCGQQGVRISA
jgi:hypothetical protein